jgi:hypothetical protein
MTPAIVFFRLFCSLTPAATPAYFATFDSGNGDKDTCEMAATMFAVYYKQLEHHAEAKCWCNEMKPAHA